ncbi:NADH-ubiquinone oxidoreductase chain E [Roseibacterium elongatum DSM 19469]|uniref:NADH-ubiquinone oxidoreductase chain E n=1 Tax=Roseicyclus elongatus DSM 19469 TaxID=1294273 RepID=W8SJG2_9RHOB|nr:hypothetical protein [Roseibacterium elongatum]AHM02645.1 NADH-ubiquinone oxidoreductase chain E [Roseibacterium elongatum DSM 19469]
MNLAEDMWLRGQAAQRSILELTAFNAAFLSNATVQAMELGLTAPMTFWSAIGRAGAAPIVAANGGDDRAEAQGAAETAMAALNPAKAEVVQLHPDPEPEPQPAPEAAPAQTTVSATASAMAELGELPAGPSPHLLDAPREGGADDLTSLKGVGAKLAEALNEFGIFHFDQIAALDADGIDWLNEQQPGFKMTCTRYDLVTQAQARLG